METPRTILALVALLGLASPMAQAAEDPAAAGAHRLDIRPAPDAKWDASLADVRQVLSSAASALWVYFPERDLKPIIVEPRGGPIVLFARGKEGEYRVRLNTGGLYWSQYSYQFAHEFCHILCGYVEDDQSNKWLEESLCEMASMFAIRRMARTWKTAPPYPNWAGYAVSLQTYADDLLRDASLPPGKDLAAWYRQNEDQLRKDPCQRRHNRIVAAALLPIFEKEPEHWEAVTWLNAAPSREQRSFEAFLSAWQSHAPARHRPFIGQIAARFGIDLRAAPGPGGPWLWPLAAPAGGEGRGNGRRGA